LHTRRVEKIYTEVPPQLLRDRHAIVLMRKRIPGNLWQDSCFHDDCLSDNAGRDIAQQAGAYRPRIGREARAVYEPGEPARNVACCPTGFRLALSATVGRLLPWRSLLNLPSK
jgi:hypothetical protein